MVYTTVYMVGDLIDLQEEDTDTSNTAEGLPMYSQVDMSRKVDTYCA